MGGNVHGCATKEIVYQVDVLDEENKSLGNLKMKSTLDIKTTSKMKTASKRKTTSKIKTTSKMKMT